MGATKVRLYSEDFIGAGTTSVWSTDSDGSGSPTANMLADEPGGAVQLLLDNTNEAQRIALHHNQMKPFDIDDLQTVRYEVKAQNVDGNTVVVFGLSSGQALDEDTISQSCWFKMEGSDSTSNVVVESDDGTNDNNDVATSQTLANTYKECVIDFTNGTDDVRFYIDNGNGQLKRVASGTTFDMSNYTDGLEPYMQVSKASGTGTPSLEVNLVEVQYKR